jgi:hypothetical protein
LTEADGFLDGISYDAGPGREEEADRQASQERLAASLIRRTAMRHDRQCREACRHRNHRRDEHHLLLLLDILGLEDDPAGPQDYEQPIVWHAISRSDIPFLTGKQV